MLEIRDFSSDEIAEIQGYINASGANALISQLFMLTETTADKVQVFISAYRIIGSAAQYAATPETREKLRTLLSQAEKTYGEILPLFMKLKSWSVNFGKHRIENRILAIFLDYEKNRNINIIIDAFVVFGERIELTSTDATMGVDTSTEAGQNIAKELINTLKGTD